MTRPVRPHLAEWRPGPWEVLLAVGAVGVTATLLADGNTAAGFRPPDLLTWVLTLVGAAAVVWARRQPLIALIITGVSFVVLTWRGNESELAPFLVTGLLFMCRQPPQPPTGRARPGRLRPSGCCSAPRPGHPTWD